MRKKRVAIAIAVMSAAVLGLLLIWLALPAPPLDPVYQGRTLSRWAEDILATDPGRGQIQFQEAVRAVGTNAIPVLLKLLGAHDSPLKLRLLDIASRQHWFKVLHADPRMLNVAGQMGFIELRSQAAPAVPELLRIYQEKISTVSQTCTAVSLAGIGPEARTAIPMLLQDTASTNNELRQSAFFALAGIHDNPDELVPLFINGLRDGSPGVQLSSVTGLWRFGPAARSGVPALVDYIRHGVFPAAPINSGAITGSQVKALALDALKKIDPAGAEKLTVESPKGVPGN